MRREKIHEKCKFCLWVIDTRHIYTGMMVAISILFTYLYFIYFFLCLLASQLFCWSVPWRFTYRFFKQFLYFLCFTLFIFSSFAENYVQPFPSYLTKRNMKNICICILKYLFINMEKKNELISCIKWSLLIIMQYFVLEILILFLGNITVSRW